MEAAPSLWLVLFDLGYLRLLVAQVTQHGVPHSPSGVLQARGHSRHVAGSILACVEGLPEHRVLFF